MNTHKKYLVWAESRDAYAGWRIVTETDAWNKAATAFKNQLMSEDTGEVIVTEFIPLEISDGRQISDEPLEKDVLSESDNRIEETGVFMDETKGVVYIDGQEIESLTNLEYRLLLLFYNQSDEIVDKACITDSVWECDYDRVSDARIEKLVSRLRAKIELDPVNPKYLITVRGRGYRFYRLGNKHTPDRN
jgi:DNA-binding winged helix-turn-helix (wHTH) protein